MNFNQISQNTKTFSINDYYIKEESTGSYTIQHGGSGLLAKITKFFTTIFGGRVYGEDIKGKFTNATHRLHINVEDTKVRDSIKTWLEHQFSKYGRKRIEMESIERDDIDVPNKLFSITHRHSEFSSVDQKEMTSGKNKLRLLIEQNTEALKEIINMHEKRFGVRIGVRPDILT
jgi:hypothetical protein